MTKSETRFSFAVKNISQTPIFISTYGRGGYCVGADKSVRQYDTMSFVKRLLVKKKDDNEPDDHYDLEDELKRKMEDKMPKGYIMVSYLEFPTDENLSNYAPKAMEAIKNAGGKFIARGMPVATYENGMNQRAVIVEFENTDAAQAAFTSDVYQAAFALLDGVKRDVRVIEGFE